MVILTVGIETELFSVGSLRLELYCFMWLFGNKCLENWKFGIIHVCEVREERLSHL